MIQQASFIDFLGMLFTIFLVLACLFQEESFQGQGAQQQYYQGSYTNHQNRNTSAGAQQKKDKKIVGEYIDFEEIE